jgi:hypothetical protein
MKPRSATAIKRDAALAAVCVSALFVMAATPSRSTEPTRAGDSLHTELTLQRGTQAVIWGIPAVSMMGLRNSAERQLGATFNDIVYLSKPMVSRHGFLTANNDVPYVFVVLDTTKGPVVLDVPPASDKAIFFGSAIDAWQVPVTDIGPEGDDGGKGGKYLFLPPGFKGAVPTGFLAQQLKTFHVYVALRPVTVNGGTLEQAVEYAKRLKAYNLSQAQNPPPGRYIDAYPKAWDTLPKYDMSYFDALSTVINEEPVQPKDLAMMGMLSSIGIEKGKPFKPDGETTKALEKSVQIGYDMMMDYFVTPGKSLVPWWSGGQWQGANISRQQAELGFPFVTDNELLLDQRAGGIYFWATFVPKHLGKGSFYLMDLRDKGGALLNGTSGYRLRVPKEVPARQFWSAIVYSRKTAGFIANASKVGIGSNDKANLKKNEDGTIDLYFGPKAPAGMESNWLPTGESFFLIFRLYSPEAALFDKTWKLPDVEKVY